MKETENQLRSFTMNDVSTTLTLAGNQYIIYQAWSLQYKFKRFSLENTK